MNLFRRKSVADLQAESLTDHSLKRALGPMNLTALGIGAVIGAGIFVLTGQSRRRTPAQRLCSRSYWQASLRLCRALLQRVLRDRPNVRLRLYLRICHAGRVVAWIIGWDLILGVFVRRLHRCRRLVGLRRLVPARILASSFRRLSPRAPYNHAAPAGCGVEHLAPVHRGLDQHRCRPQRRPPW